MFTDEFGNFTEENVTTEEYLLYGSDGPESKDLLCHNYNVRKTKT